MKNLNLIVNQNEISQNGNEYLTSGGYKSIQCNFSFSEEWNNLTKTAIFLYNGVAYNETLIDDKCFIPHEAIENKGELSIGVFGTEILGENLEKRNTTDLLNVKIYEGSFIKGIQPEKPSPETWELYLEEVNKLIEEATNKIDSFTAEDIKFEDGETFQEKYDNGEFAGGGSTIDENKFMKKEIYDIDDDGIVDNSLKVNNHTVESDVPANAIFTDTTYDIATKTKDGLMSASDKQKLDGQVAELDEYGKVLSSQLPSYVDDVVEATLATFPESGESGKIYVDIETNLSYRWTGTAYTVISPSIALGETPSTAYRGDRGKTAYEHSQETHAPVNAQENVIENIKLDGKELQVENKEINLNLQDNLVCVNSTEPTDDRKKVWLQKGKNLLDEIFRQGTQSVSTRTDYVCSKNDIYVEAGETYTFSTDLDLSTYRYSITITSQPNYKGTSILDTGFKTTKSYTFTAQNNGYLEFIIGKINGGTVSPSDFSNNHFQLEHGSTATEYEEMVTSAIYTKNNNDEYEKFSETVAISSEEPANQNGLWLQKSKNIFQTNINSVTSYGVTATNNSDGSITISGTNTSTSTFLLAVKKVDINNIYDGNYTISLNNDTVFTSISIRLRKVTNTGKTQIGELISLDAINKTSTLNLKSLIDNDTLSIEMDIALYATIEVNFNIYPQLEIGSTATDYEEYKEKKIYTKNDNGVYEKFINADEVKNDYSLAERKIGTWIDGKPLYRKTINFGALPNTTNKTVNTYLPSTIQIRRIDGIARKPDNSVAFDLPKISSSSEGIIDISVWVSYGYFLIEIKTNSDRSDYNAEVTLEYTKTTDVATTSEE